MANNDQGNSEDSRKRDSSTINHRIDQSFCLKRPSSTPPTRSELDQGRSSSKASSSLRKIWARFSSKPKKDSLPAWIQSSSPPISTSPCRSTSSLPSIEARLHPEIPSGPGRETLAAQTMGQPQAAGTATDSILTANLKLTGRFFQTVVTKSATIVDGNPVKIALGLVKAILEAKNVVEENNEAVLRRLVSTGEQLSVVVEAFGEWNPSNDADRKHVDQFKSSIRKELQELKKLAEESTFRRILDYEDEQKRIAEIFERVNGARILFELAIGSRSFRIVKETDGNVRQIHKGVTALLLDRLKPAVLADHTYYLEGQEKETISRVICTPGTRVRVMNDIIEWANDASPDCPRLHWIFGPAGSGKTTIAFTTARRFEFAPDADDTISLGASFFCSRQSNETKQSKSIVRTIAYQLATKCKPFADALQTFDAVDQNVSTQVKELLVKPWEASNAARLREPTSPNNYLIVIDALDEIQGDGGSVFLDVLVGLIEQNALLGLRFLVTSRPDPQLVQRLGSFDAKTLCRLQDVEEKEIQDDILAYLVDSLPDFEEHELMEELVKLSSGLFIYAATVVKRLAGRRPLEQITFLRKLVSTSDPAVLHDPHAMTLLDRLYHRLLSEAFENFGEEERALRLQFLHTMLCALEPVSTSTTAYLHVTEAPDTHPKFSARTIAIDVLNRLHAVLYVKGERVLWFHKSFPDFIFDSKRSKTFSCVAAMHHRVLTDCCLRIMKEGLRFNIANIQSSFLLDCEDNTLSHRIKENIRSVLSYSCRFWGHHLSSSSPSDPDALFIMVTDFLQNRGLFWIEAMNLLESRGACQPMLDEVHRWVLDLTERAGGSLAGLLSETASFALYFSASGASSSTPHLYLSSLATWPRTLDPCQRWKMSFPGIPGFTNATQGSGVIATIEVNHAVKTVGLSNDGKYIVGGTKDGVIYIWDAATCEELKVLQGHEGTVWSVAFSSDGKRIVSGSKDTSVRVWDSRTGEELKVLREHTDEVKSVAFSSDGKWIVSGSSDRSVKVWDRKAGKEVMMLWAHDADINSVAFSSDGKWIVSGSSDRSVKVWDSTTGSLLRELGHQEWVCSVAFSSNGKWIVCGTRNGSVKVWDSITGKALKVLSKGHHGATCSVAFSSSGERIASGSSDMVVRVWDGWTGKDTRMKVLKGHDSAVNSVAFSSDGKRIVSGSDDMSVRLWDSTTGEALEVPRGHLSYVKAVTFSRDGERIASGSNDHSVRMWDSTTGAELRVLGGHTGIVTCVAFSNDGQRIVSGAEDNTVRVWDSKTGEELKVLRGRDSGIASVAFSSDGTRIVSGSMTTPMIVRVWDSTTGEALPLGLRVRDAFAWSVAFSGDGKWISCASDKDVRLWDGETGKEVMVLMGHDDTVLSVAFSDDGQRIVSGSRDRSVRVWDSTTGKALEMLRRHDAAVWSVDFSSDGKVGSGSEDGTVRVWEGTTGEEVMVLSGHHGPVWSVAFSDDGKRIVSGSHDNSVRVWDSPTSADKVLKVLAPRTEAYHDSITASALSPISSSSSDAHPLHPWAPRYPYVREISPGSGQYTGWLLSADQRNRRLMYVPSSLHLPDSSNILTIPSSASASVDFANVFLGPDWSQCYSSDS